MKKFLKVVLALMLLVSMVIGLSACSNGGSNSTEYKGEYWYDYGIGQYVPTMKLRSGKAPRASGLIKNNDNEMFLQVENASKEDDFADYVGLLIDRGFVNDVKRDNREYIAVDGDQHKVRVYNWGNGKITVEASVVKK